jgi:cytochrome c2
MCIERIAKVISLSLATGMLALATPIQAAPLAKASEDVRAGSRIARDICRSCHVIDPAQTSRPILRQPGLLMPE